ncbi:MAG: sigma-54 dependent transcriptional regulator, partial [Planctomycetota bacterium]
MSFIFIIDDDKALCRSLEIQLKGLGHRVEWANRGDDAVVALTKAIPELILLDLGLPDRHGLEVLSLLKAQKHNAAVVIITGQQDMKAAIEAMRIGAFDYIRKPFDIDDIVLVLEKIERFQRLRSDGRSKSRAEPVEPTREGPHEIIGKDKNIIEVVKQIGLLSRSRITVLVEGASGTGKELVGRALHEAATPDQPFVAINCSAVVQSLPESELFGYEKGAFTGADERKMGKLEYAKEGTVFLDEIGDMPLDLQAKILRVLQERVFERVGGLKSTEFKARVIAATNRDLESLVSKGRFRQDLFYRLAVAKLHLPSLKERRGDIPDLVHYLIHKILPRVDRKISVIEEKAMQRLLTYDWPGNVRELENVL